MLEIYAGNPEPVLWMNSFSVHHAVNFELQVSEIYQLEIFRQKWACKMQLWCNVCLKNCSVRYLEAMRLVKNGSLVNLAEHKNQLQSVFVFVQLCYSGIPMVFCNFVFFTPYRSHNCDITSIPSHLNSSVLIRASVYLCLLSTVTFSLDRQLLMCNQTDKVSTAEWLQNTDINT